MILELTLTFDREDEIGGYIGHPYWYELNSLINIEKESRMNMGRSDEKRREKLIQYLQSKNLTMDYYLDVKTKAARPFYTVADLLYDDGHGATEIVIPPKHIISCIVAGCDSASAAIRISPPQQVRNMVKTKPFFTGKYEADGIWNRNAIPKSGTGQPLSNQRGARSNPFIGPFQATGKIVFDENLITEQKMIKFLEYVGQWVGVGAARNQGWGRFKVANLNNSPMQIA